MRRFRYTVTYLILAIFSSLLLQCSKSTAPNALDLVVEIENDILDFGEDQSSLVFTINKTGKGLLNWEISAPENDWITFDPRAANINTQPSKVTVNIDRQRAPEGQQQLTFIISGDNGQTKQIQLLAQIRRPVTLRCSIESLDFGSASREKTFNISTTGTGQLQWKATPSAEWISLTPASGSVNAGDSRSLTVTIDRIALRVNPRNDFTGNIDITSNGGDCSVIVTATEPKPELQLAPDRVEFVIGTNTAIQTLSNQGDAELEWEYRHELPWLTIHEPQGKIGQASVEITMSASREGLAANTYEGTVRLVTNTPDSVHIIPVRLFVDGNPALSVSNDELVFAANQGVRDLEIANIGNATLNWRIGTDQDWLTAVPDNGAVGESAPTLVQIVANRRGLAIGEHLGLLTVTAATGGSQEIPVRLIVEDRPILDVEPRDDSIEFPPEVDTRTIELLNTGTGQLAWEAGVGVDWLELSASSGSVQARQPLTLTATREGLLPGLHMTRLRISSEGGSQSIDITLEVLADIQWSIEPAEVTLDVETTQQTLTLSNGGNTPIEWQIAGSEPWMTIEPASGQLEPGARQALTVTALSQELVEGRYAGSFAISADNLDEDLVVPIVLNNERNEGPIANAGPNQDASTGMPILLDGRGSQDSDGDRLTFAWRQFQGPAVVLDQTDVPQPSFTATEPGTYRFSLVVSDGQLESAPDTVAIQVTRPNTLPLADAGPDQTVLNGDTVLLDGRNSQDEDGDRLSFAWQQTAGPTATLEQATTALPVFTPAAAGEYRFELTVDDGHGGSATDGVIITVNPLPPSGTRLEGNYVTALVIDASQEDAVQPGQTIQLNLEAYGLQEVTRLQMTLEFAPEGLVDLTTAIFEPASPFTSPGVEVLENGQLQIAAAVLGEGVSGTQKFGTLLLQVSPSVRRATPFQLQLIELVVGTNDQQDNFAADVLELDLSIPIAVEEQPNESPTADAGSDLAAVVDEEVALDGQESSDPDADPLVYLWTQVSGPAVTLIDAKSAQPRFIPQEVGTYEFELRVDDGLEISPADLMMVVVSIPLTRTVDGRLVTGVYWAPEEIEGVAGGQEIRIALGALGLEGVRQFTMTLALTPADGFDLSASRYEPAPPFITVDRGISDQGDGRIRVNGATIGRGADGLRRSADGDRPLGNLVLVVAQGISPDQALRLELEGFTVDNGSGEEESFTQENLE